jgi:arylsulfatase A-like enzyme
VRAVARLRRKRREAAELRGLKRRTIALALWAVLFLAVYGGWRVLTRPPAGPPPRRPSVLLVVVDSLRADHLSCYGYARPTSPAIDAFAARSLRFARAYAQATWTLPSVTTLMTGLYPPTHRVEFPTIKVPEGLTLLGERFRAAGYRTGGIVTTNFVGGTFRMNQGLETFDESLAPIADTTSTGAAAVDKALAFVDGTGGAPFFLFLHLFDPHVEYKPPDGFRRFGDAPVDLYDGEIAYTDREFGRLVDALADRGVLARTVVVLTADHGEEFYEHGINEHGTTLYEMALHVPLIASVPGRPGEVVTDVASLVDVAPTLLKLAGLPPDPAHEGRDLLASPPTDPRSFARLLVNTSRWTPAALVGVLTPEWHLIDDRKEGTRELYRLSRDPNEERNLARALPDVSGRLAGEIDAWLAACRTHADALAIGGYDEVTDPATLERLRELGYIR